MMPMPEPELRELVQRHQITYRVQPEWGSDANWNQQKVGLEIELHGSPSADAPERPTQPADDRSRHASYEALREVARWALGTADGEVCVTIDPYFGGVQHDPSADTWVVELVAHVLHCGSVRRPLDGGEQDYVRQVTRRLSSIGVAEK
jgi:hypothetical protein